MDNKEFKLLEETFSRLDKLQQSYVEINNAPCVDSFETLKINLTPIIYLLSDYLAKAKAQLERSSSNYDYVKAVVLNSSTLPITKAKMTLAANEKVVSARYEQVIDDDLFYLIKYKLKFANDLWDKVFQSVSIQAKSEYAQRNSS